MRPIWSANSGADPSAEEYDADLDNVEERVAENDRRGISVLGDRLWPVEDTTTVRIFGRIEVRPFWHLGI
jgi:hypothetical protein